MLTLLLAGCVSGRADLPDTRDLSDVTPMSQADVDHALAAPEIALAVRALAAHQPAEMLRQFRLAADAGNAVAMYQLAQVYRQDGPVARDDKMAFDYARMAAEEGLGEAEVMLAIDYLAGRGVAVDREIGMQWLHLAEAQDRPAIWVMAGALYLDGLPLAQPKSTAAMPSGSAALALPPDPAKALSLFRRAADLGNEAGESKLCLLYMKGQPGMPPSPKDGQPWCDRAAARGNLAASQFSAVVPKKKTEDSPSTNPVLDAAESVLKYIAVGVIAVVEIAYVVGVETQYSFYRH